MHKEQFLELQADTCLLQFPAVLWIMNLPQSLVTTHEVQALGDEVGKCLRQRLFDGVDECFDETLQTAGVESPFFIFSVVL